MQKINLLRNYNRQKSIFIFLLTTIFFFLSVKYKQDNVPSVKPLYSMGLLILGILCTANWFKYFLVKKVNLTAFNQTPIYFLAILIMIFGASSMLSNEREIKDFIYFLYWNVALSLFLIFYLEKYKAYEFIFLVCKSVLIFSIVSSIIAFLTFFGIVGFEYGEYVLRQNLWTITRIHGYMGEPTALGGLLGFSVISFFYISKINDIKYKLIILFILIIAIIASGSRNTVVSLLLVGLFASLIDIKKSFFTISFIVLSLFLISTISLQLLGIEVNFLDQFDRGETNYFNQERRRLSIWANVLDIFKDGSIMNILFGHGSNYLNQFTGGVSAFNASLEILIAHGIFGFIFYQMLFISSVYLGVKRYKLTKSFVYKYGLMLLIYGYSFSLFMSFFPSTDFHFSAFAFIFGILIVCIPVRNLRNI